MTQYSKFKDFKQRQYLKEKQPNYLILSALLHNVLINKRLRFKIMLKREIFRLKDYSITNRCMFSTKARAVSRVSNMTKASFKDMLSWGKACGFKKASW